MRVKPATAMILSLLPLAACGSPSPVAGSRAAAEETCLDQFSAITHLGTENISTTDDDPDDNVAVSGPVFRKKATGEFGVDFPPISNLDHPYRLRCTGDLNKRILTSVQVDGVMHLPPAGAPWTF